MSLKHRVRFKGWKRLVAGLRRVRRNKQRAEALARELARLIEEGNDGAGQ